MPTPTNDRTALEDEVHEELPAQLAAYQQELAARPVDKVRQEWFEWQIRRVRKRMADLEARLARRERPV